MPGGKLVWGMKYGALVVWPRLLVVTVPAKKATFVTVPSTSLASASTVKLPGAKKKAPLVGLRMLTVGGWLIASEADCAIVVHRPTTSTLYTPASASATLVSVRL